MRKTGVKRALEESGVQEDRDTSVRDETVEGLGTAAEGALQVC